VPANPDTFPRLLMYHAHWRDKHPALREKDLGIWQTWTWAQVAAEVRKLAAGLHASGLKRGDHLAIVGENRPRLYFAMMATQCLGGVPVPMYQDAIAGEMIYVFHNAEIRFAIVEDQEQVDKMLEVREQHADLTTIVYDDTRGMRNYTQPGLTSFDALLKLGEETLAARPSLVDDEIALGSPDDTAALFYTSGTTGKPKGVVQTHHALIDRARACTEMEDLNAYEDVLAYLPQETRSEIIQRVASLEIVQPSAMEELEAIMKKQFSNNSSAQSSSFGGVKAAARIMNLTKTELEASVILGLNKLDPDLTMRIQDNMYTFENLTTMDNRGIQVLMRNVDTDQLMIALKGATEMVKDKFFGNMSERARGMFRDDMEAKGPLRIADVEEAQKTIMRIARKLSDAGDLVLGGGDDFV
jgi:acyl-CoA synthetase (AMP-forming)/AMP-acid ligase II